MAVHSGLGQSVLHPDSLAALVDPACMAQDGEMLGDTRLGNFQDRHEITNAYLAPVSQ